MLDRRKRPRRKIWRGRLWLAGRWQRWVELLDSSEGGARIALPGHGLEPGELVIVHRALGEILGRGRAGHVVHVTGMSAGLSYDLDWDPDLPPDGREAPRRRVRGIWARVTAARTAPAAVVDLSATGARLDPIERLVVGAFVVVELLFGGVVVATRRAEVVRASPGAVGVRFVDGACSTC